MDIEILNATPEPEATICRAARNDYGGDATAPFEDVMESVEGDTIEDKKHTLLKHLISREHYGPLEHVHASFSVKGVSRVVMSQATRHRHLSFDIQSQRYCDFSDEDYTIPKSFTDPDHFTRDDGTIDMSEGKQEWGRWRFESVVESSMRKYERLVKEDFPKEDARYVLPTAMQVDMVFSGNLRALLHVVSMRSKADVQGETRQLAVLISNEINTWTPTVYELVDERMPLPLGL
jgi:thymidylate synthase (FAD)